MLVSPGLADDLDAMAMLRETSTCVVVRALSLTR